MQTLWQRDPAEAWLAYEPSPADPWDLAKVLRLHRRAGFGATWAEAQRDLADGYQASIARVSNGAPNGPDGRPAAAIDAFTEAMYESYRSTSNGLEAARTVWFYRMVFDAFPLQANGCCWPGTLTMPPAKPRFTRNTSLVDAARDAAEAVARADQQVAPGDAPRRSDALLARRDSEPPRRHQRKPGPRVPRAVRSGRGQLLASRTFAKRRGH